MTNDEFVAEMAAHCRNCMECSECPCGACLAGGICDQSRCTCDDPPDDDDGRYEDDERTANGGAR